MSLNKKLIIESLNSIVEEMMQNMLNEEAVPTADDLFDCLNNDPNGYTFAYAYYTYPVTVNKWMGDTGRSKLTRVPENANPMHGKIFKSALIPFRWDETYRESAIRKDPNYVAGKRSGTYVRDETHSVIEHGPNGDYLPIVPSDYTPVWAIRQDDGSFEETTKEAVQEYLKPPSDYRGNKFIPLKMGRLYRLSAGKMIWVNPDFEYTYFGPAAPVE